MVTHYRLLGEERSGAQYWRKGFKGHCVPQIKQALECDAVSQNKANWYVYSGSLFVKKRNTLFYAT